MYSASQLPSDKYQTDSAQVELEFIMVWGSVRRNSSLIYTNLERKCKLAIYKLDSSSTYERQKTGILRVYLKPLTREDSSVHQT